MTEAWTGPQVAWKMARGDDGAFGGRQINSLPIWLGFCVIFFLGLADLRRPLSVRNLDLLVLLSFSVSLWFFNRGDIFTSVPLAYPPMLYLLGRMVWIRVARRARCALVRSGRSGCSPPPTVFLVGFRVGLNVRDSNVIDVGYSGVIGAHRIVHGESPYGHMPRRGRPEGLRPRGRRRRDPRARPDERPLRVGERARRHVRPGRLRGVRSRLRAARLERQVGRPARVARDRDRLRPARPPRPVPRRAPLRGRAARRALPFAWAAYPVHAVRLELEHERRDHARVPRIRLLVRDGAVRPWSVPRAGGVDEVRGARSSSRCGPTYPEARRRPEKRLFAGGFAVATVARLLDPPARAEPCARRASVLGSHLRLAGRPRFAVLDLGLGPVPRGGHPRPRRSPAGSRSSLLVAGAVACYFVPRHKTPLQLAALTGRS